MSQKKKSVSGHNTETSTHLWKARVAFGLQGQSGIVTAEAVLAYKAENIYYLALYTRSLLTAAISHRSAITVRKKQDNWIGELQEKIEHKVLSTQIFRILVYENKVFRGKFSKLWYSQSSPHWVLLAPWDISIKKTASHGPFNFSPPLHPFPT